MLVKFNAYPIGKSIPKVGKDGKLGKIQYTFISGDKGKDGLFTKCEPVSCWSDQEIPVSVNKVVELTAEMMVMNGGMAVFIRYIGDVPVKADETTMKPLGSSESLPFD